MTYVCILGRQPALGIAELETRFGSDSITVVQPGIILLKTEHEVNFNNFGGVLKVGQLLTTLGHADWDKGIHYVQKTLPEHLQYIPDGKITVGVSVYGLPVSVPKINAGALSLKKVIKNAGRSARVVPNKEAELNSAQIIHNQLTGPNGLELLFIKKGSSTLLAQSIWVQDIDGYRLRDQERPMRDSRVGMLPPKLAQIIINLAVGPSLPKNDSNTTLLDPFCGTGVILQEALLQGLNVLGTDLEPRMVDYSQKNLEWLSNKLGRSHALPSYKVLQGDATSIKWPEHFDLIACETYLGRPFSSQPDPQTLQKVVQDVNTIHKKFLQNVASQTETGFRMCIAVPAWKTNNGFTSLPVLDHLEELGYNRVSLKHVQTKDLIYHREGQIVARELAILTRR
jgi:tRNA G10  N-methylase Trm11